ncbi:cation:proton antiporter [Xanthobacter tagetidis]|uniref:cation:proton antiporter n=1 Tax=Xanthobacter tagetidis TaxID=60216 RepID=UPI0016179D5D|nr:monovalent cation/H(+) antiporter subunit G [Xanthobacter tagetidis]MBB6310084.1 multicomponent Na+:H+ antiporter subunit G [Xanthobacter tagetidis]
MSLLLDAVTLLLVSAGVLFFAAGTLGLLRLPDPLTRIHALTKADNVGLALIVLGLLPQAGSVMAGVKMIAVWALAQIASGAVSQVLAEAATLEAQIEATAREKRP